LILPAQSQLTVVHRQDCDLCDEMVTELESLGREVSLPPIAIVDVDGDPELGRRYGLSVPVLLLDGTVVCRHRLDVEELRRLLRRGGVC
jgi:predicted thioredoxin/glutaredoxin